MFARFNRQSRRLNWFALAILTAILTLLTPGRAAVADTASATPITSIPYSDTIDFSTAEPDTEATYCTYGLPTVWYSYTASSDIALVANASITNHAHISVFTGSSGSLSSLACDWHPPLRFEVSAGETVYIAVNDYNGSGGADTFTLELAPPALDVQLTLDGRARLGSEPGTVVISGTVACNNDARVYISGTVRQSQGLAIARAPFYVETACSSSPRPWTVTTDEASRVFLTKSATVSATASGCDNYTCDADSKSRTVRIVR